MGPTIARAGMTKDEVLARLREFAAQDLAALGRGRAFGYLYDAGCEVKGLAEEAFRTYLGVNALDPTAFPSALALEREVVGMAIAHLGGGDEAAGTFTSGGTESIMLAVKTARDHARATRPAVARPRMVLPVTAHAAFHKAAHYLGLEVDPVPVDPTTFRADLGAVRAAIREETVLLVGSASDYTHGVVDPIPELGELALERGLLLHVDGCIGGFLLPWFRRLGEPITPFDLTVPGVTSISMDFHKYGFVPKGASCVVYRTRELRRHQIYACARWTGYALVNPGVQSSRSVGPLAATWAVLRFLGEGGYLERARAILAGKKALEAGIARIPGLRVLGRPEMSLVAVASEGPSVFEVSEALRRRGWFVPAQPGFAATPANLHFLIDPVNAAAAPALLDDLSAAVEEARGCPPSMLAGAAAEALAGQDPKSVDAATYGQLLGAAGVTAGRLPERLVEVNQVLDALPPEWREELLCRFANEMYA